MYADEHKVNGDFWLTGSQMFHMMQNISESLAGRAGILNLFGLSNSELNNNHFGCFNRSRELLKRLPAKNGYYGNIQHDIPGILPAYMRINKSGGIRITNPISVHILNGT